MPGYEYGGTVQEIRQSRRHLPFSREEMAAKIAYFRDSESKINGGPAPIPHPDGCGTNAGYWRHFKRNEPRCEPCKAAHSKAEREWQRRIIHSQSTDIAA